MESKYGIALVAWFLAAYLTGGDDGNGAVVSLARQTLLADLQEDKVFVKYTLDFELRSEMRWYETCIASQVCEECSVEGPVRVSYNGQEQSAAISKYRGWIYANARFDPSLKEPTAVTWTYTLVNYVCEQDDRQELRLPWVNQFQHNIVSSTYSLRDAQTEIASLEFSGTPMTGKHVTTAAAQEPRFTWDKPHRSGRDCENQNWKTGTPQPFSNYVIICLIVGAIFCCAYCFCCVCCLCLSRSRGSVPVHGGVGPAMAN